MRLPPAPISGSLASEGISQSLPIRMAPGTFPLAHQCRTVTGATPRIAAADLVVIISAIATSCDFAHCVPHNRNVRFCLAPQPPTPVVCPLQGPILPVVERPAGAEQLHNPVHQHAA